MGWVKSYEIPEDHWLRSDLRYIGAWTDLLQMAEYKEGRIIRQGEMIEAKRGTVYTSIRELAARWGVSRKWVDHFIGLLEADGMIEAEKSLRGAALKVSNYAKYQDIRGHRGATEGATEEPPKAVSTYKITEYKEYKNNRPIKRNGFSDFPQRDYTDIARIIEGRAQ